MQKYGAISMQVLLRHWCTDAARSRADALQADTADARSSAATRCVHCASHALRAGNDCTQSRRRRSGGELFVTDALQNQETLPKLYAVPGLP